MVIHVDDHQNGDGRNDNAGNEDNRVGYGRPPKHSQFKKGQSGNPNGRRPRSVEYHDIKNPFKKILLQETSGTVNGKQVKMTKGEAMAMRLYQSAMKGNDRAANILIECCGGVDNLFLEPKFIPSEGEQEFLRRWKEGNLDLTLGTKPEGTKDN